MKLFELDPNNPVDRELQKTANDATTDGSLDQQDIDGQAPMDDPMADPMADPMGGPENAPDPAMGDMPPEEPEEPVKPVDSDLMSIMQNHDYMKYDHSDPNKESNPLKLMALEMDELSQMINKVTMFISQRDIANDGAEYDNEAKKAAIDMKSFLERVASYKKKAVKSENTATGKPPKVRKQTESKVKPGQKFKHKRH